MADQAMARIALIGLGQRGTSLLRLLSRMPDVSVTAVCDIFEDRIKAAQGIVQDADKPVPAGYGDYREMLERDDVDGVIIPTPMTSHATIALDVMRAGKYVAIEAGGAASLEECWALVRTAEETGMPCMFLENCCYGRKEMALLNMVSRGLFGELVHCEGGYEHDLRELLVDGNQNARHTRIYNYISRNGDLYPTHGLGPIAKYLRINKGNRMVSLVSVATGAVGMHDWIVDTYGPTHPLANTNFTQGDIVTTMIRCANGETLLLTHDTTLTRPYSRGGMVQGTKGIWVEDGDFITPDGSWPYDLFEKPGAIHLEKETERLDTSGMMINEPGLDCRYESFERYVEAYEHPLWKEFIENMNSDTMQSGMVLHGGMDYLTMRAFAHCVKTRTPVPIDVYDAAAYMAITCLSEESVAKGGAPVMIPDFTSGKWIERKPDQGKYSLDIRGGE